MAWEERQLPRGNAVYLDHVGYFVHDIDAVGARLARLGFTVQPVSVHYNAAPSGALEKSGTANRLVTFALGYIEVLAAVADTPLAAELTASLDRYEGLHLIALTHADVRSRDARFAAAGLAMQPTVELRRNLDTAAGPRQVKATVARCQPGVMPEGRAQMLTHRTPELIWLPGYDAHPNQVDALVDMLVVSADPADAAHRYALFSGCETTVQGDLHRLELERGWLSFAAPEAAAAILPGLRIPDLPYSAAVALRSTDLAGTRAALAERGVPSLVDTGDLVCVGPDEGIGAYLVFHAGSGADIWPRLGAANG